MPLFVVAMCFDEFVELARAWSRIGKLRPAGIRLPECAHTIFQCEVVLEHLEAWKHTSARRCSTKMVSVVGLTPLPCATWPTLLGEATMRRKVQGSRWGEVPKSGADTHLFYQLILPPLSTGPNQTHTRR